MNLSDQLNAQGFLAEIAISGEMIAIGDSTVIANVNHQPRFLEMMESGYLDKEPVEFEILKGYAGGTGTMFVNGLTVPVDLRGAVPKLLTQLTYPVYGDGGIVRKIMRRQDAGDRWILTTIRDNVAGMGVP